MAKNFILIKKKDRKRDIRETQRKIASEEKERERERERERAESHGSGENGRGQKNIYGT